MIKVINEVDFSRFEDSDEHNLGLEWEEELTLKDMLRNSLLDDVIGKHVLDHVGTSDYNYWITTDDRSKYVARIVKRKLHSEDDNNIYIGTAEGLCEISLYYVGSPEQMTALQGCKKMGIIENEDRYDSTISYIYDEGTRLTLYIVIAFDRLDGWRVVVGNEEAIYSFIEQYTDGLEYDVKEFSESINGEQMYYIVQDW